MKAKCDECDRPATWHAAWRTSAMPAPAFAYACDEHRFEGMTPFNEPLGPVLAHLPTPGLDGTYRRSCIGCTKGTDTMDKTPTEGQAILRAVCDLLETVPEGDKVKALASSLVRMIETVTGAPDIPVSAG